MTRSKEELPLAEGYARNDDGIFTIPKEVAQKAAALDARSMAIKNLLSSLVEQETEVIKRSRELWVDMFAACHIDRTPTDAWECCFEACIIRKVERK